MASEAKVMDLLSSVISSPLPKKLQLPYPTLDVLGTSEFSETSYMLSTPERAKLSYQRAESAALSYKMTMEDIQNVSPKFWQLHQDPITLLDGGVITLMTIQYNLCVGTIAHYIPDRPDLIPLVEDLLKWRKYGQFLITEVGHGVDMGNLETTATMLPSGEFLLHSPTRQADKFMPPTIPVGKPSVGIVFARLIIHDEDRGIRPFIVALNDGKQLCRGITAKLLPERGGAHPVNHTITSFNNVCLPPGSLLGSLEKPTSVREHMSQITWRVAIGSMALGTLAVPMLQSFAFIGAKYSIRRKVGSPGRRSPIIQFRTQQVPVLTAIAQAYVMKAYANWSTNVMRNTSLDSRVRHGIATIMKAVMVQHCLSTARSVGERCGAQGLFEHNQISAMYGVMRGASIAEGEVLALSIRLATELLQGRYQIPRPNNPDGILALHEAGLFDELRTVLKSFTHHRSEGVNKFILPNCLPLVEAIGHRMAFEAAVTEGLPQCLIDLYVSSIIKLDSAWYSENTGLNRQKQVEREAAALDAVLPHLQELADGMGVEPYIIAPIVSDEMWDVFVDSLPTQEGNGRVDLWEGELSGRSPGRTKARL